MVFKPWNINFRDSWWALVVLLFTVLLVIFIPGTNWLHLAIAVGGVLLAAATMAGQQLWLQNREIRQENRSQEQLLDGLLRLHRLMVTANDERALIENSLEVFAELSGAIGCTFMPLDEWGQPLPAFAHGKLPQPVLRGWAEHLAGHPGRAQCRACKLRHAPAGTACPLMDAPLQAAYQIYCLPLWREERMIGMMNLYLPPQAALPEQKSVFIEELLHEFVLALEILRLRNQEIATLRHLQLGRGEGTNLNDLLKGVFDGVSEVLELDGLYLQLRGNGQSETNVIQHGDQDWLKSGEPERIAASCLSETPADDQMLLKSSMGTLVCLPLRLAEGGVVGVLLAVRSSERPLNSRQAAMLAGLAEQAARLVENDTYRRSLELRVALQERVRLAREIHDGLAQTLAFLKLNAAQMQNYLQRHEYQRLDQALRTSYQALTEAYLDTRQAIDHLRLNPADGINSWLEQICDSFETNSGLIIQRSADAINELPTEIQAQLMRILQEALNNVRKHAEATRVEVGLRRWQDDLLMEVRDDGRGFLPEDIPDLSRHGLRGMQERAELLGADFQVISQPGKGTTVRLRLPLSTKEALP